MDALDRALRDLRVTGSMVGRTLVDPPWGLTLDTEDPCVLAAVLSGDMWVRQGEAEPVHVTAGDVVMACGGVPLHLGDRPDPGIDVVITDRDGCHDPVTGADLSESCRLDGRTFGDPDGSIAVLVGSFHAVGESFDLLAADLPDLVVLPATSEVTPIIDVIAAETQQDSPGFAATIDRLMELLAFATLRTWLRAAASEVPSWASALGDPVVGPALRAMHADPARAWTVAELAGVAAVSRATFARLFSARVGEAPLSHLGRWRMAVATDLMRAEPRLGLGEVAARVGYGDAFSFSNAYRRIRGQSPSAARRAA